MNDQPVSLPRTFKLAVIPMLIYTIIPIGFSVLSFFGWHIESVTPLYFVFSLVFLGVYLWWVRSVQLEMTLTGVSYRSGITTGALNWGEIKGISYKYQNWGTSIENAFYLTSKNPAKRDIKINEFYFSGKNFIVFFATIIARVDRDEIDPMIAKWLSKRGLSVPPTI